MPARTHRSHPHPARRVPVLAALVLAAGPLLVGCGADDPARARSAPEEVTLAAQSTTEGDVLTALYRTLLEQAGYRTTVADPAPREKYLAQLADGRVQLVPEYVSVLAETLRGEGTSGTAPAAAVPAPSPRDALAALETLAREQGLAVLEPARAEDVRSFAVTRAFADRYRLRTLSDLARTRRPVALAGDTECAARTDCARGLREVYGIRLSRAVPTGIDGGDTLEQLRAGGVQLAQVSSTDGRLVEDDVVVLEDDRGLQPAQQVVPVADAAWLADEPTVRTQLARLARVLTTAALRELNAAVDAGPESSREAAQRWLGQQGLL